MAVDSVTHRDLQGIGLFLLGILLTVITCGILGGSVDLLSRKRDTALTIGTSLPELTSSVTLLRATVAAERLFTEQSLLSQEEQAAAYVLPERSPVPRFVRSAQAIVAAIGGGLKIETMTFDKPTGPEQGIRNYPGRIVLRGTYQDVARFLGILGLSGKALIRDVLPATVSRSYLAFIEETSPLALKDAVRFLFTDLLAYAAAPDQMEKQALRDLPANVLPDVRSLLLQGGLSHVRASLSAVAPSIRNAETWPLPLVTVTQLDRDGDRWTVEVTVMGR
ncbi:MAG: hypothetical protein PHZ00_02715 [Candidatus Peribacteraceae bacterium]|nr:hypothetical protein [Candidatus Peribacteraceae bacterium]